MERRRYFWTVLLSLIFAAGLRAGDKQQIAIEDVPEAVAIAVRDGYGASLFVRAWKETEDGRECYTIRISRGGKEIDLVAPPDGRFAGKMEELYPSWDWIDEIIRITVVIAMGLIPAAIASAVTAHFVRATPGSSGVINGRLGLLRLLAGWLGAAIPIGVFLFSITTAPREKDWAATMLRCIVWSGASAAMVAFVAECFRSIQARRVDCWYRIVAYCLLGDALFCLVIPVEVLSRQRNNQVLRHQALRMVHQTKK
jgi:hypothetical protein